MSREEEELILLGSTYTCREAFGGAALLARIPVEHVEEGAHATSNSWRLRTHVVQ
jgi:hypothetical protein